MSEDSVDRPLSGETTLPEGESGQHLLHRGDILGGRFVVLRFLAQGGMGVVYEVADQHLQGKHCALKTLRPDIAQKPELRRRFEREVLLAREIRHPNVCPTYDIFNVQGPGGPVTFLTMELLQGESLLTRLQRVKAFDAETLASIAKQMAEALDAAHRAGVIHRDFKPGNVMLEDLGMSGPRVSITDFGLSRAQESDPTLAETGQILGTPGYIAPELIQGQVAQFSVDVYSFGVVLYEMATGSKPIREAGKSEFVRPSTVMPGLPQVWDRIILGCLEPDPVTRFRSAGEAISLLGATKSSTTHTPIQKSSARRRLRLGGVAAALLAAVLVTFWIAAPGIDKLLHPLPPKRFVALMPWPADSNPQHRSLLKGVLDTINSRLARAEPTSKDLLIISQGDVTGSSLATPADAISVLGANLVLAASTRELGDELVLDLAVIDAKTSKELRRTHLRVASSDVSRLPDQASIWAAALLDVPVAATLLKDQDELAGVPAAAYQFLTRAEDLMTQANETGMDQAIEQYQKALDVDSHFALAYARLSTAYSRKFQSTRDRAYLTLAERNADLALRYNPESAKSVLSRATVDRLSGRIEESMDGIQRALQLDPGSPQILMDKAFALRALDRRADEEAVYKEILKERPNFWPAYYELGFALTREGNYQKAQEAFAEGVAVAPHVARLLTNLGTTYLYLDRKEEAEDAFRRSLEEAPNEVAYLNLGTLAFSSGDYRKALASYEKARDLRPRNDVTWRNIADCYAMLGEPVRATESFAKAAEAASEVVRTNPARAATWMNLAFYEAKLGHVDKAEMALREAGSHGASDLQSQFKRVQVMFLLGHHEESLQLLLDCLKKGLKPADVDLALDLNPLRNDPRYQRVVAANGK